VGDYARALTKIAYYNDICVGAVRSELQQTIVEDKEVPTIYIMTLGVLAPYRCLGIGSLLLDHIISQAKELKASCLKLHIQTSNESAKEWYLKRGFIEQGIEEAYYKKTEPRSAYILRRDL